MAIKRFAGKAGTLVVLEHESKVLKDNLLGDPHRRKLAVWLPPQYDAGATAGKNAPGRRFPVLFDLVGFTGFLVSAQALEDVAPMNVQIPVPNPQILLLFLIDGLLDKGKAFLKAPRVEHRVAGERRARGVHLSGEQSVPDPADGRFRSTSLRAEALTAGCEIRNRESGM